MPLQPNELQRNGPEPIEEWLGGGGIQYKPLADVGKSFLSTGLQHHHKGYMLTHYLGFLFHQYMWKEEEEEEGDKNIAEYLHLKLSLSLKIGG